MIYGEHEIAEATFYPASGNPSQCASALMGIRIAGAATNLTRADVERLRDLCNEALS